jgi:hypothetical protein
MKTSDWRNPRTPLDTLTAWAAGTRGHDFNGRLRFDEAKAARAHGIAAVRAIRPDFACGCSATVCRVLCACRCHNAPRFARLAFRAALNAVGLKGALDCRENGNIGIPRKVVIKLTSNRMVNCSENES